MFRGGEGEGNIYLKSVPHYEVLLLGLLGILEQVLFLINQETLQLHSSYANRTGVAKEEFLIFR